MRRGALASVIMLIACQPKPATFSTQDEAAVRALADSAVRHQLAGDWPAFAALYSEDGVLHPPNAPVVQGRAALIAWGKTLPPVEKVAFTNVQVWGEGNLSYGTSSYAISLKGLPPDTGKQLWVSRRGPGGKWEVVAVSFNSNLPMPSPQGRTASAEKRGK